MSCLKKIRLSLCLLLCSFLVNGQIISIVEKDRGSKRKVSIDDKQIIDINSTLEVEVSKTKLLENIKLQFPEFSEQVELDTKINTIRQVLKNQSTILTILKQEVASPDEQEMFFNMMKSVLDKIQSDPYLLERYETLSAEYFESESFVPGGVSEPFIFSNLNNDIIELKEAVKTIEIDKYKISVVAYKKDKLGGRRVHVKNFDTYSDDEYFFVERWVTSLSETQKQQLTELAKVAKENNELAVEVFQELKTLVLKEFPSISCVTSLKDGLKAALNNTQINVQLSESGKEQIAKLIAVIKRLEGLFAVLKTDVNQWSITTPFVIGNQIQSIIKDLELIKLDVGGLMTQIFNSALTNARTDIQPLVNQFNNCYTDLRADFEKVKNGIALLFNKQENYLANKEIGEEVIAFSLDNLPVKGFVNLKGTGQRASGDQLLLGVVLRIPSREKEGREQRVILEEREFDMLLLGVRSEVVVGLIFANPFDKNKLNLETDRDFYYAPSASLVLKFGSKSSYFYNDFLDLGVGLNFAAPDFNTDGTPEFGTGLIATAFKDIVSIGLNYNITLDHFYWFFGVNLPFNLPGLPVNTIKP